MGNSKSQPEQRFCPQFLPEEKAEVDRLFDTLSSQQGSPAASHRTVSLEALKTHVGEALPSEMVTRLYEGMQRLRPPKKAQGPSEKEQGPSQGVSHEQWTAALSLLLKGNASDKSLMILNMISASKGPVKVREVQKFTEDLLGSVVQVLTHRQELRGWTPRKATAPLASVQALAAQLLSEMKFEDGQKFLGPQCLELDCKQAVLESWVFHVPLLATLLSVVIRKGFLLLCSSPELATLVPECHVDRGRQLESVLDVLAVVYLNSFLAPEQRRCWRLLFATELHGQSFSQMCGRVTSQGPCLIFVQDRDGYVFGGFVSCSLEIKPHFQGDDRCFLFTLAPNMAVFTATSYKDNQHAYLNCRQQTMPNGLGMGGQCHYFGFWISSDFGKGYSKAKPRCTTYNSPQLSAQEDFQFDRMEVWGVEDPPEIQPSKKSILDSNPEARVLLEASGRPRHSEGLREVPEDYGAEN